MSDTKKYASQVALRSEELLQDDDTGLSPDDLDLEFIRDCFEQNERGDGILASALLSGKYICVRTPDDKEDWYVWDEHVWQSDEYDSVIDAADAVACAYERYADDINQQKRKRLEQLELERETQIAAIRDDESLSEDDAKKQIETLLKKPLDAPKWMGKTENDYRKRAYKLRSQAGVKRALYFAPKVTKTMSASSVHLDQKKWLLPCPNGVIDMQRGVLLDGHPEDLMTRRISVPYDPEADYSFWQEIVDSICIDPDAPGTEELPGFIKRLFGYAATGNVNEESLVIFLGPGRNGKGTIIETITELLGPFYHKASRAMFVEQKFDPPPSATSEHMAALQCKRLVVGGETNRGQRLDFGRMKDMTGGGDIAFRKNYGSEKTARSTHTIIIETNNLPPGMTREFAMLQRLLLVELPYMFVDDPEAEAKKRPAEAKRYRLKNKQLKEDLKKPENLQGVLRWIVEGCLDWQENGLQVPQCLLDRRNELAKEEDYFARFIQDIMVHDPEQEESLRMKFSLFYKAFCWWWAQNIVDNSANNKCWQKRTLTKHLREREFKVEKIGGEIWVYGFDVAVDVQANVSELRNLAQAC